MVRNIDNDYIELRSMLAKMCENVVSMVGDSAKSLIYRDEKLAQDVILKDKVVDDYDIKIDELAMRIIALYEPKASDLRYIITALRIITDLERIGDHAKNISKQTIKLADNNNAKDYPDFLFLANEASKLVGEAVDAYFNSDEKKALQIIRNDDIIDEFQTKLNRELIATLSKGHDNYKSIVKLINIVKRIERIADHAKNIAELVVFMISGKILRHSNIDE